VSAKGRERWRWVMSLAWTLFRRDRAQGFGATLRSADKQAQPKRQIAQPVWSPQLPRFRRTQA
jgi:hypothetical protein